MTLSYVIIGNKLFKQTPDGILHKYLSEAHLATSDILNESCGAHQTSHGIDEMTFVLTTYVLANYDESASNSQKVAKPSKACKYSTCSCK